MLSQHLAANCQPIPRHPKLKPLTRPPLTSLDHHRDAEGRTAGQRVIELDEESSTDRSSESDSSETDSRSTSELGDTTSADAGVSARDVSIDPGGSSGVVTVQVGGR